MILNILITLFYFIDNEEDIFNNPNIDSKDQEIPDGNLI